MIQQYVMQQQKSNDASLQEAFNTAIKWSKANSMNIKTTKSKEMLILMAREKLTVHQITIDDEYIERVNTCTFLGTTLNEYLNWDNHIDKVYKKACQWLHFVLQLKRTKVSSDELVQMYVSLIKLILEYGCQLRHRGKQALLASI